MEIILNESNFKTEVVDSALPVLVDFWASWCGPCRAMAPIIADIADEYAGKVKVGKVNVDDNMALATKYGISSIPTLILFKNGEPVDKSVGLLPPEAVRQFIDR